MLAARGRCWRNCDSRCSVLEQVEVYCPSPDFASRCADCRADTRGHFNFVSQLGITNNRCAPSCEGHKRKVGAHQKFFGAAFCPSPLANCFRRHCIRHICISIILTFYTSNVGSTSCRFWDIQCRKMWPWNPGERSLKVIKSGTTTIRGMVSY